MKKPDLAHELTDQELAALEKRIAAEYKKAADELTDKINAYFESFKKRDEKTKALIGTIVNGREYTEQDYKQWRLAQIGRGKRFEALRDRIAERMTSANEVAAAYINDNTPSIYSLNRNYAAYTIEQQVGHDVGFDLWDEQTVKRLLVEEPDLMPYYPPKRAVKRGIDLAWGKRQITAQVTSGILQGESIKHLSDRLQTNIPNMNRDSAINAARTAVTGAQNAGRQDSYDAAVKMGIELEKEWIATLDDKTRSDHAKADGQTVAENDHFTVGGYKLMYPGDPSGPGHEIYRCRCTMIAKVNGADMSDAKRRARDAETGESVLISDVSYSEWANASVKRSGGVPTETYMIPVNAGKEEIEKLKGSLDYETAEKLVGAQQGFSYRAYAKDDGMSSLGHAMFADSTDMLDVYGGESPRWFSVSETQLADIGDLKKDIIKARKKYWKTEDPDFFSDLSDEEFFEQFSPDDIVMSAAAYDDDRLVGWFYENVLEPRGIAGVKTPDGAIVYDSSIVVRNLPMEVYTKGDTSISAVKEMVQKAVKSEESAEMLEYLNFKNKLIERYGADKMYADMTDNEMDTLDQLERIAYKGK